MRILANLCLFGFVILTFCPQVEAQNTSQPVTLSILEPGAYSIIERSDWRRFDNDRYVGLVYQELRASILPKTKEENISRADKSHFFQGNFFVMQNTVRDTHQVAQGVDAVIPVSYELKQSGEMVIENDQGYPRLRGFPSLPSRPVRPGDRWQAPGSRASDPLNTGHPMIIPFLANYEYRGTEMYRGTLVHRIHAGYASRYLNINLDESINQAQGDIPVNNGFSHVQGSHNVDILIRVQDGLLVFMRDNLDVTYTMTDGSTMRFTGFTLTFGQGIVPMDRGQVIASVNIQHSAIDIVPVPEGIRLTIRDIRFAPDSAEFLPEERYRLDLIAEALKQVPDRSFLVDGHTAAVGRPVGEMELSIERAKRMIDEMVRRGINADRFIYKGWGGTVPVDTNSTEAGRNNNRRVEITILE